MAIDSIGLFPIEIDLYKKHKVTTVYANDGDIGGRGLAVTLIKDGVPYDSTGLTLKIGFLNAQGQERLYDFTEIDPLLGKYQIVYPVEMLEGQGKNVVKAEIKGYETATNRLVNYNPLYVYVSPAVVSESSIVNSQEGSTLSKMINDVKYVQEQMGNLDPVHIDNVIIFSNDIIPVETLRRQAELAREQLKAELEILKPELIQVKNDAEAKIVDIEDRFQALTAGGEQSPEIIEARQGFITLGANLNSIKGDIATKATKAELTQMDTTLNENINLVDANVVLLNDDLTLLQNEVSQHLAESATQAHLAKNIGLEDTASNFIASNIEGAMSELFTNVSDGKDLVGGAITDVDDSVVIPADPTFNDLASAIGGISTGKKWASGEITSTTTRLLFQWLNGAGSLTLPTISVSSLGFRPSIIIIREKYDDSGGSLSYYSKDKPLEYYNNEQIFISHLQGSEASTSVYGLRVSDSGFVSNGGFKLPVMMAGRNHHWIAFE